MGELRKDIGTRLIAAGVPARPGADAVPFRLFAPPLPFGWAWRYRANPRFITVAELATMGAEGEVIDMTGAVPTYDADTGALIGYDYPGDPIIAKPSQFAAWAAHPYDNVGGGYYGTFRNMVAVQFDWANKASNGYPIAASNVVLAGYFDIEDATGTVRVTRNYKQDASGIWRPQSYTNVARVTTTNGVAMWSGFPGREYVPSIPDRYGPDYMDGWNAGANSEDQLDNNVRTEFTLDASYGIAVGLYRGERADPTSYANLENAFYVISGSAGLVAYVMERGAVRSFAFPVAAETVYEIKRVAGVVTYSIDGTAVYGARELSFGPVRVGTAIFHGGDGIP